MLSKITNDIKYFFNRLFDPDNKTLLMLSIISIVLAIFEIFIFLVMISNATKLNVPFLLLYMYLLYFINRFLIRGIQYLLSAIHIFNYHCDDADFLGDSINKSLRKHNAHIFKKEQDRYYATIIYIVTIIICLFIILTFVLETATIVKIILTLLILIPFLLCLREPYEIITIDVNEQDKYDMTKKDFIEKLFDKIFKENQITSIMDLPINNQEPINQNNGVDYSNNNNYNNNQF